MIRLLASTLITKKQNLSNVQGVLNASNLLISPKINGVVSQHSLLLYLKYSVALSCTGLKVDLSFNCLSVQSFSVLKVCQCLINPAYAGFIRLSRHEPKQF